jgi:hypothetical protein
MGYTDDLICQDCLVVDKVQCPCGCGSMMTRYTRRGDLRSALNMSHYNRWQRAIGKFNEEWKHKIGEKSKGRMTPEVAKKAVATRRLHLAQDPERYGPTAEFRQHLSQRAKRQWQDGKLGTVNKPEAWARMATTNRQAWADGKRQFSDKSGHGKKSKYTTPHGEKTLKSSWELAVARVLDVLVTDWYYEPKRFKWDTGVYIPDFWVPEHNLYLEIKGYVSPKFEEKFKAFQEAYPTVRIAVVQAEKAIDLEPQIYRLLGRAEWAEGRLL